MSTKKQPIYNRYPLLMSEAAHYPIRLDAQSAVRIALPSDTSTIVALLPAPTGFYEIVVDNVSPAGVHLQLRNSRDSSVLSESIHFTQAECELPITLACFDGYCTTIRPRDFQAFASALVDSKVTLTSDVYKNVVDASNVLKGMDLLNQDLWLKSDIEHITRATHAAIDKIGSAENNWQNIPARVDPSVATLKEALASTKVVTEEYVSQRETPAAYARAINANWISSLPMANAQLQPLPIATHMIVCSTRDIKMTVQTVFLFLSAAPTSLSATVFVCSTEEAAETRLTLSDSDGTPVEMQLYAIVWDSPVNIDLDIRQASFDLMDYISLAPATLAAGIDGDPEGAPCISLPNGQTLAPVAACALSSNLLVHEEQIGLVSKMTTTDILGTIV